MSTFPRATRYPISIVLEFPYNADLIEAIKREFAPHSRSYDPQHKFWTIKEPHGDRAIGLLREFFPYAIVETIAERQRQRQEAHPPPPRQQPYARTDHFAALYVIPSAPPEVVRAAYGALVKLHHPDILPPEKRDQGHKAMLSLNAAIEALRADGAA